MRERVSLIDQTGVLHMSDWMSHAGSGILPGSPIIITLHSPREKIWGVLLQLSPSGVYLRGIDLNTFEDWLRMIVRGERNIGLTTAFFPMWRIERASLDETVDDIPSMADRFYERVGMTIEEYLQSPAE
ncbi:MAG TPA: hypothetical protein VJX67_08575 [Blastocatellia bacterium]|nr:hypothetical protein [Blastocatellia bacterium]